MFFLTKAYSTNVVAVEVVYCLWTLSLLGILVLLWFGVLGRLKKMICHWLMSGSLTKAHVGVGRGNQRPYLHHKPSLTSSECCISRVSVLRSCMRSQTNSMPNSNHFLAGSTVILGQTAWCGL